MIKFIPFRFCGFRSGGTPKSGQALLSCRRIRAQEDVEQPVCDIKEHYDTAKSWSEDVSAPKFLASSFFQLRVCSGFGEKKMQKFFASSNKLEKNTNTHCGTLDVDQIWSNWFLAVFLARAIHLGLCTFSFLTFLVYEGRLMCLCRLSGPSFEGCPGPFAGLRQHGEQTLLLPNHENQA